MPSSNRVIIAARDSPLSRAQVREVIEELKITHPHLKLIPKYVITTGDRDKTTSLRDMGKTDFFTKQIDELQLSGQCRLGLHSAKDLPEPLRGGLKLVFLTKGVDSSDALVLREGESLFKLKPGAPIATSSERREDNVRALREDLSFVDCRGMIHERLELLEQGVVDGVVIAEAALIRLGLTHLNRHTLPGETNPLQGRLALIARSCDREMCQEFDNI